MIPEILKRLVDSVQQTAPEEYSIPCPFHDDQKPSCSVNVGKRVFSCHACDAKGNVLKLLSKLTGVPETIVKFDLENFNPLDQNYLAWHRKLKENPSRLEFLQEKRKWSLEIIDKMKIGFNGERITIPIFDCFGFLVNVRLYKPGAASNEDKVLNVGGHGKARLLYTADFWSSPWCMLVEGEPDFVAAATLGFPAGTQTAGAKHFNAEWAPSFRGRKVYVCFDTDSAGVAGARKITQFVQPFAQTGTVDLSLVIRQGKDLTDYILQGGTKDSILELVDNTPLQEVLATQTPVEVEVDSEVHEVSLFESSQEKYYRKRVKMKVMVSGKMLSPYIVPKELHVKCPLPNQNICKACAFPTTGGSHKLVFNESSEDLLSLVETATENHARIFKKACGIPTKCGMVSFEIKEAQNIEESKVIPDLDYSTDDSQYVLRQIFYIGHGLEPNTIYEIEGIATPHPKTQQVTYVINRAIPLEDTVSAFKVTDEVISNLRIFQVDGHKKEAS